MPDGAPVASPARTLLVIAPWQRRWELGGHAGLADDIHFIRGFCHNGWDVHYVSPRDDAPPDPTLPGCRVHGFFDIFAAGARWPVWLRRLLWPVAFSALATGRALDVARRVKPDVILGQSHLTSLAVFLVSIVRGVPSVIKLFGVGTLSQAEESHTRHLWRNAEVIAALRIPHDLWIVLDDGTAGDVALRRHGVPSEKIRFLPNGVDLEWAWLRPDGGAFRRSLGIADDARVVLWLARLVDWKRADLAIRAFAAAREHVKGRLVLVVGGDGPERDGLGALCRGLGVGDVVRFAGPIPHDEVPAAMAAAALFVATNQRSNKSVSTCEAMLCGVPVVAFDAGGTSDVVRDGETGRLVRDGDTDAFARAMADLLNDDLRRSSMGAAARSFARARFTGWERRVEMERELVERLSATRAR